MLARRRMAAVALALPLLTGLAACGEDGAQEQVPGQVEDVAPGTREEGVPEEPLNDGASPSDDVTVPSESAG